MNVEVPPEPGGIASHPRMKNPSSSLQLQQPGGGNGDPTCRYRPAGCRKPNSTGRFLFHGPSARKNGTPFANVEVPPLPGEIGCHLRRRNHSTSLQHQHPGSENGDHPGQYPHVGCGNLHPTGCLLIRRGSWSQNASRVSLLANVQVPPQSGTIGPHPCKRNTSTSLRLQQP